MTVQRGPHRYVKDETTTRPGCYVCGRDRFAREHQGFWWRLFHPGTQTR